MASLRGALHLELVQGPPRRRRRRRVARGSTHYCASHIHTRHERGAHARAQVRGVTSTPRFRVPAGHSHVGCGCWQVAGAGRAPVACSGGGHSHPLGPSRRALWHPGCLLPGAALPSAPLTPSIGCPSTTTFEAAASSPSPPVQGSAPRHSRRARPRSSSGQGRWSAVLAAFTQASLSTPLSPSTPRSSTRCTHLAARAAS